MGDFCFRHETFIVEKEYNMTSSEQILKADLRFIKKKKTQQQQEVKLATKFPLVTVKGCKMERVLLIYMFVGVVHP